MKEIKAFIRANKAEKVIQALENFGIRGITLIDVMGMGELLEDKTKSKYSIACVEKYSKIAKLEIVCKDHQVHEITEIIRQTAYSGQKGDGLIYVSSVEMAVNIRTGAFGEEGL